MAMDRRHLITTGLGIAAGTALASRAWAGPQGDDLEAGRLPGLTRLRPGGGQVPGRPKESAGQQ